MRIFVAAVAATLLFSSLAAAEKNELVLKFDHKTGHWQKPEVLRPEDYQVDLNGVPTLFLPRDAVLKVQVINTNPLLFKLTPDQAKAEDVSGFKEVQEFVSLLGGALGRFVGIQAARKKKGPFFAEDSNLASNLNHLRDTLAEVTCLAETVAANRRAIVVFLNEIEAADGSSELKLRLERLTAGDDPYRCRSIAKCVEPIDVKTTSDALQKLETAFWALRKQDVVTGDREVDKKTEALLKDVDTLVKGSGTLVVGTAEIQTFVARMKAATVRSDAGTFIYRPQDHGTLDLVVASPAVKWNQRITRPFKLRLDSSFSKEVATRRPELDVSFATAWRGGSLVGIGVGIVYTPLTSPTWSAAPKPGSDTVKVVTRTDEETRAGAFGLFLNFRFLQAVAPSTRGTWFVPALQIGTGFDPSEPSFYAGGAFELFKYVRMGVGCTWQQVKRLNGQIEGVTEVSGDSDIKTRDGFDHRYYVSLSIAIDNLSLFDKPK